MFVPTGAFLYDVAGFSLKWLRDLAAEQLDDGRITNYVPDPLRQRVASTVQWPQMQGSSGWGDAIVMVPWELWRAYGDHDVLAEFWPSMVSWVDFAAQAARTHRHPSRQAARPEPAPHERSSGTGPTTGASGSSRARSPTTTCSWTRGPWPLRSCTTLPHWPPASAASSARTRRQGASTTWRPTCCRRGGRSSSDPAGALTPDTQANHVRALAFGLVPDELRAQTAERLVDLIRAAGTHLGTGFLATPYLLPVLADTGHLDVAYELLLQDTPPSWLAMVERGATTVWESWEGIDEEGRPHDSLNHYSKGAVISFLHNYTAGITLLDGHPAYRRFRVEPRPGGGITWAEAVHDSPYGRIESSWHADGSGLPPDGDRAARDSGRGRVARRLPP